MVIASFFFQLSEDSCKSLTVRHLRGPGRRKSLTTNDLRDSWGFVEKCGALAYLATIWLQSVSGLVSVVNNYLNNPIEVFFA
jgi:hypothetical protein